MSLLVSFVFFGLVGLLLWGRTRTRIDRKPKKSNTQLKQRLNGKNGSSNDRKLKSNTQLKQRRNDKKGSSNDRTLKDKMPSKPAVSIGKMKYYGYINGRDKRVKVPEDNFKEKLQQLSEDELTSLKEYLNIIKSDLDYVYACPVCQVRITHQSDMIRAPHIWDEGNDIDLNATFRFTTNMMEKNGEVCCYRCNSSLGFAYRSDDRNILTLPMLKPGFTHTFLRRPFRLLCLVYSGTMASFTAGRATEERIYNLEELMKGADKPIEEWRDLEKLRKARSLDTHEDPSILAKIRDMLPKISDGKAVEIRKVYSSEEYNEADYDYYIQRKKQTNKKYLKHLKEMGHDIQKAKISIMEENKKNHGLTNYLKFAFGDDTTTYTEKIKLLNEANSDLGFTFCLRRDLENLDVLQVTENNTYDLAVYFKLGSDNPHADIFTQTETDCWAAQTGTEKVHLILWALSGGNFMFGTYGAQGGDDRLPDDGFYDKEFLSQCWLGHKMEGYERPFDGSNGQIGLAKLIQDGHWLGQWGCIHGPSEKMQSDMKHALAGKYLYPQWLFLHDYPETVVNPDKRWKNGPRIATKVENYIPLFYYDKAKELYCPTTFKPKEMSFNDDKGVQAVQKEIQMEASFPKSLPEFFRNFCK